MKLRLSTDQFRVLQWKCNLKKGKPEHNSKTNNNLMISFQFLQGINTKSLARHEIWITTQT